MAGWIGRAARDFASGFGPMPSASEDAIRAFLRERQAIDSRLATDADLARGSTFALRARNAEPSFLDQLGRDMQPLPPAEPLIDQLNRARRARQLTDARLDRLTPEQRQSSLASVARSAEENLRDMRQQYMADGLRNDALARDLGTAAAIAAVGGGLALKQGVPSGGMMEEAAEPAYLPPGARDFAEIQPLDIGEDDIVPGVEVPMPEGLMPATAGDLLAEIHKEPAGAEILSEPGPETPVAGYEDFRPSPPRQAPPPENPAVLRTIQALTRAGIPPERATGIAKGKYSMTPAEYRAVTGRQR